MGINLDDYNDVAARMTEFFEKYPEGSLRQASPPQVVDVDGSSFVVFTAAAYRDPNDPAPAHGTAWEPVPGKTPYTRDSEMQNAETSAWGRAIMACGAADAKKGIASREEVRNRQTDAPQSQDRDSRKAAPGSVNFAKKLADDLGAAALTVVPSIIQECTGREAKLVDLTMAEIDLVIEQLKEESKKAKAESKGEDKARKEGHDARNADAEAKAAAGEEPWDERPFDEAS